MSELIIRRSVIAHQLESIREHLQPHRIHFPVKCNPDPAVLSHLADMGVSFEIASWAEAELLAKTGIDLEGILFSAPFRTARDVEAALQNGVTTFVVDSVDETEKIAAVSNAARVVVRLHTSSAGSLMPLARKFGCGLSELDAIAAVCTANDMGVDGVTFHVGSQAQGIDVWGHAVRDAAAAFEHLQALGHTPTSLDIGGGFPVRYSQEVPELADIAAVLYAAIDESFETAPQIVCEPGRFLVGPSGTLATEVVGTAHRGDDRWLFLETGIFNGLAEAAAAVGGIEYPIDLGDGDTEAVVLAGASCDGTDIIGRDVVVPAGLRSGDTLRLLNTGAYTNAYAAPFCGFDPPMVTVTP
jgi:ornithine decarboxylase